MYYSNLYDKLSEFGHHHQIIFGVIVALCAMLVSWGIERILDVYIFPSKHIYGYLGAVIFGLSTLWIVQHFVLHVF